MQFLLVIEQNLSDSKTWIYKIYLKQMRIEERIAERQRNTLLKAHMLLILFCKSFSPVCELLPSNFSLVPELKLLRLWRFGSRYLSSSQHNTGKCIRHWLLVKCALSWMLLPQILHYLVWVGAWHYDILQIKELIWKKKVQLQSRDNKKIFEKWLKAGWKLEEVFWKNCRAWDYA